MKHAVRRFGNVLLPLSTGMFTYEIAPDMPPPRAGDWVQVPLRKNLALGVYTGDATEVNDELREMARPVHACQSPEEAPFLPEALLRLIQWSASYYMCPEGAVLKYAVPAGVWKGLVRPSRRASTRTEAEPPSGGGTSFSLSPEQSAAIRDIASSPGEVFLIKGVTGSGKTEVYLRAIEQLEEGAGALVLVPEIALTGQMVDRFRARFGDTVAVFHSGMSEGVRKRSWNAVRAGKVRVAIGVRSAVFLPFERLAMIVVDEEHSATYKQGEGLRYNARDLSVVRGSLQKATVLLGSATPSLESYENTRRGKYRLTQLTRRVEERTMPTVKVVDMKTAPKASPSVSEALKTEVEAALKDGGQVLLLVTRRGFAHVVMCADCGHVEKCPSCSVSLTHHKKVGRLRCHHCGGTLHIPVTCSHCGGTRLLFQGEGSERAEEEIRELFPALNTVRMDFDTTRRRDAFADMIQSMESGENELLLGTQMIAKGHDFPGVQLAGVISGDVVLGLPDFRASEKGYQLFSQLSGRAGRGKVHGRVLIQTHDPEHMVFRYVMEHDYDGFAANELELRKALGYPPYARTIRLVLKGRVLKRFEASLEQVEGLCAGFRESGVELLGPAPCPLARLRGYYRWHILLKSRSAARVHSAGRRLSEALNKLPSLSVDVDVDPIHML